MIFFKFTVLRSRSLNLLSKQCKNFYNTIECDVPVRPINVTITGANSGMGQILALLLKQCSLIDEVRLFDYKTGPCGTAMDLSHIDTNTKVKSYTGLHMLRAAVEGAKVVTICGGEAFKPDHSEYNLFENNADYVRNIAIHTAEFNPKAILCIATPPITAMVPLATEEYKRAQTYDSRKIMGVTTLAVMRANTIVANYAEQDPSKIMCPTIGGMGFKTTVAVVSQTEIGAKLRSPVADVLRNKVARAENDVLQIKYIENTGPCAVTAAFATARFITSVIRGLLDIFDGVECAYVRQTGEIGNFLPYMTSIIRLGNHGIQSIHMPKIDNFECVNLQRAAKVIQRQIEWGEGYVTGLTTKKKRRCKRSAPPCPNIKIKHVTSVGDICFDPSAQEAKTYGKLVPRKKIN